MHGRERANGAYILFRYLIRRESEILSDRIMAVQQLVATKDVTIREVLHHISPQRYHLIVVLDANLETLGVIGEKQLLDSFLAGNGDVLSRHCFRPSARSLDGSKPAGTVSCRRIAWWNLEHHYDKRS